MRKTMGAFAVALAALVGVLAAPPAWAATFEVNSTGDGSDATLGDGVCETGTAGECTLRAAIEQANASSGEDLINFRISGDGVQTIAPASPLPEITEAVTIDGYSQPGASANTLSTGSDAVLKIQLSPAGAGSGQSGLRITGAGSTVKGLAINLWSGSGVLIRGAGATNNKVEGNHIGTDASGSADLGNSEYGVVIDTDASNNVVGGITPGARNVISGNGWSGVYIYGAGATGNRVEGNHIGTDASGSRTLGNSQYGAYLHAPGNVVGGTTPGAGNVISGNGWSGVYLFFATNNRVEGNYIGTDASGQVDLGNSQNGVYISYGEGNVVGGTTAGARNVISGNGWSGVSLNRSGDRFEGNGVEGNRVEGNYVGTDASGSEVLGNSQHGVVIDVYSENNVVGGATPGAGNVISGNGGNGVLLGGVITWGNKVEGNYIGTDASGSADLGNSGDGVVIEDATGDQAAYVADNVVGGTTSGARNVISGNGGNGVLISGAQDNRVQGNYVGTDASGSADLGNSQHGVYIDGTRGTVVGGATPGAGNVISGNSSDGVQISGTSSTGNRVEGNHIGTDASGSADLGNSRDGVHLFEAPGNVVGGGARNVVSGNGRHGVAVSGSGATGNRIFRNSISDNSGSGIDLLGGTENAAGVTANDAGDPDSGPNRLQNFPVINSATTSGGETTIEGTLNSTANDGFVLQFFRSPSADPSGHGEGETYVGETFVFTDSGGNATFDAVVPASLSGQSITATATNATTRETSEFSEAVNDRTSPAIEAVRPAGGARAVKASANVSVSFSEPMKGSSFSPENFSLVRLSSGEAVPASLRYAGGPENRAVLNPTDDLLPGRYTAAVKGGAAGAPEDLSGEALPEGKTWTFAVNSRPIVSPLDPDPRSSTSDATPRIRAVAKDRESELRAEHLELSVDGKEIAGFTYDTTSDVLSWVPAKALGPGWHRVEVTARDPQGLERTRAWSFKVTR